MNITYNLEINAKPGRDGRHTVLLRITAERKHRRIKTGVSVKLAEFDKTADYGKWIRTRHPDHKALNIALKEFIQKAEAQQADIEKAGSATADGVIYRLSDPVPGGGWTLGKFVDKLVADAEIHSVGYQRNLKSRLGAFVAFAGPNLPLSDIGLETLNRFKRHLQGKGQMNGTQHTYFNRIKRMTLEALKLDLIEKDPFRHFDMPPDKPAPRLKLTDKQVQAIEEVDVSAVRVDKLGRTYDPAVWLFRAKWLYLFAYQMGGIRSRDILQLRHSNIVGETGAERLEYQMSKTGEEMSTRLTRKAKEIIALFVQPDSKPSDYLFGILANDAPYAPYLTHDQKKKMSRELAVALFNDISSAQTQINGELKILAEKAGITERLTFHTARHSFADKARRMMKESNKVSIDDIRQALGHQRLDTTQRYLNSFDKEGLDSAMEAIFGD